MLKDKYGATVLSGDRASSMTVWINRNTNLLRWRLTIAVQLKEDFDIVVCRDLSGLDELPFVLELFRNRRWFGRYVTNDEMKLVFRAVIQLIDQGLEFVFESSFVFGHLVDD